MSEIKLIPIKNIKEGMICGDPVLDNLGRHLVERGAVINAYIIENLKKYGIEAIPILFLSKTQDLKPQQKISPAILHTIRELRRGDPPKVTLSKHARKKLAQDIEKVYHFSSPHEIAMAATDVTKDLYIAIESNNAVAINLNDLRISDEYTYKHSIDVAVLSMMIAKQMNYSTREIYEIGEAGLLHDIGKTRIPPEILNKPARLTDEEFKIMKQHSYFSYAMVENNHEIPRSVARAMMQHHEKLNGSGYPLGLKKNEIHPYAKILAVADIYDALVTERPYKKAKTPREAIEMMYGMISELDENVLKAFLQALVPYPVDSTLLLSNGELARVVRRTPGYPLRPVVVGLTSGNVYNLTEIDRANIVIES